MKLFKIFNIQIKISYLIFFILIFSMFFNYFSRLMVLIVVILIHELAHCCVCVYYGIGISEIEIFIFGGVAKFQKYIEENPKQEIIIALAGPVSNFILVVIMLLIMNEFNIGANYMIQLFLTANAAIGLFNLIPILPLDGGRVARGIVGHYVGIKRATYIVIKLGYCICILLFVVGTYMASVYDIEYVFISFLSIYMFLSNRKEKENIDLIFAKNLILRKKSLFYEGIMDVKHIIAMESVDTKNIFDEFTLEQYCIITITDVTGKVVGSLSESEIIDAIIEHGYNITLGDCYGLKTKDEF
ncbi:MAG: M50 family metallopeptidase [Natronincolaceae bacterium]|nr:M50 family metallopeptidase [Bacillota bacterium]NLK91019.1 hypothetical protein [Clostridiales bacterium]